MGRPARASVERVTLGNSETVGRSLVCFFCSRSELQLASSEATRNQVADRARQMGRPRQARWRQAMLGNEAGVGPRSIECSRLGADSLCPWASEAALFFFAVAIGGTLAVVFLIDRICPALEYRHASEDRLGADGLCPKARVVDLCSFFFSTAAIGPGIDRRAIPIFFFCRLDRI
jgi:hypothetical protein